MNGERWVSVTLHDVAPARWDGCTRVLRTLGALGRECGVALPVTLLVVPRWHAQHAVPDAWLRWLQHQLRRGHGVALHGWTHHDDAPPATHWRQRLLREVYTDGEGEFAALDLRAASARLAAARAWALRHGLPDGGFVPPAWLLNEAGRRAVQAAGFDHLCTFDELVALPEGRSLRALPLVFSTRARWRRVLSCAWVPALAHHQRHAPLLRLELHPDDAEHDDVRRCWVRLLRGALHSRRPARLADVAERLREGMPPALRAA